jgi:hypothetical protein
MIGVDAHVFMTITPLIVVCTVQAQPVDSAGAFQMQPMEPHVHPTVQPTAPLYEQPTVQPTVQPVQPTAPPLWPVPFYGSSSDSFSVVPSYGVSVVPMSSGQAFSTF